VLFALLGIALFAALIWAGWQYGWLWLRQQWH
jgi:hypothetical protein